MELRLVSTLRRRSTWKSAWEVRKEKGRSRARGVAGVFLVARSSFIYEHVTNVLVYIAAIDPAYL
jgi:hypothetical protein